MLLRWRTGLSSLHCYAVRPGARDRRPARIRDGRAGPYLSARPRPHRLILPVWTPGKAARVFRSGANLAPDRAVGGRTWEEILAARMSSSVDSTLART